jgi:uncharacterized membrane protein YsdA (DUF1294 family)/cold shock CspA family protein
MRYTGKLTNWKDTKGFGFITSNSSGKQIFVHIKSFLNRQRRPVQGDTLTYEILTDDNNRHQAVKVLYREEELLKFSHMIDNQSYFYDNVFPYFVSGGFLSLLISLLLVGILSLTVLVLYLTLSLTTFAIYLKDKSAAQNEQQRTPENLLHFFSLIGGWPGALAAMKVFHHKSKKKSFQKTFWITVSANCLVLLMLLSPLGIGLINNFLKQ